MSTLGRLGEFELIRRIATRAAALGTPEIILGIGDDAAILRPRKGEDLVVTTDALVENTHFRFHNQAATTIGRRALLVNLSDLAAMGARPVGFTLALTAPPSLSLARIDGFLTGLLREAKTYACPLIGGNLSRARETCLSLTVVGAVKRSRALLRGAARPGDRIFVTGTLGGAALALAKSRRRGAKLRHLPTPRIASGRALARMQHPGAVIDLSDGFEADLGHVLRASGVGAAIDVARIPTPRGFASACAKQKLDAIHTALRSGEDYELLFTLRQADAKRTSEAALSRRLGVQVSEVGRITKSRGVVGLPRGAPGVPGVKTKGFRHF